MADIELVIKVPEEDWKFLKESDGCRWSRAILEGVINGTPLDDVKAEMQRRADDPWNMAVGSASKGLEDAIEILDNISETESEDKE